MGLRSFSRRPIQREALEGGLNFFLSEIYVIMLATRAF